MQTPAPIATKAVRGAAWTILTGIGSRALGLVGTVVLTYFLAREVLGEVSDASIAVLLANQFSTLGVGQYYISKPSSGREVAWHATMLHVTLGVVALAAVLLLEHPLSVWMKAPALARYLPGFALATLMDRVAFMPERVLARDMRFHVVGVCRTAGEITYTVVSVGLAVLGYGGMSIVIANVARSAARMVMTIASVDRADWLTPSRFSARTLRQMLGFGVPHSLGSSAGFAARRIDNALVSSLFGAETVGVYNLAYNVADVPAVQVGEQIGDVLLPSFAHMTSDQRKAALVRSTGLLALVVFPLAIGLGAVAPTVVSTVLRKEWQDVAPMLSILSAMAVARPIGWTISSYLLAWGRPRAEAALEGMKLVAVVVFILTIGRLGPLWACVAVGVAFAAHALASMAVVQAFDGIRVTMLVARCAPPLAACAPMVLAVVAARLALAHSGVDVRGIGLAVEIAVGAVAYVGAAFVFARAPAQDFLQLVRRAMKHTRGERSTEAALRGT
jgi:PST family polysaccharide transporter